MPRNATRTRIFVCLAALLTIPTALAQVVSLKAGDSFSHEFTELAQFAEGTAGEAVAQGIVEILLSGDLFEGDDEVRVDMFKDRVDGTSLGTRTARAGVTGSKRIALAISGAWKDLKGAFRVAVTKGSIGVTNVSVTVVSISNFPPYSSTYFGKSIPLIELFPPALNARRIEASIELSWPASYSNLVLEAKSSTESLAENGQRTHPVRRDFQTDQ